MTHTRRSLLCPCSEMDWSGCDMTAEHHPDCVNQYDYDLSGNAHTITTSDVIVGGTFTVTAYGKTSKPLPCDTTIEQLNEVLEELWVASKAKTEINVNVQVHGSLIHESQLRNVIREAVWRNRHVSTATYQNISTGEAINILLDTLKYPADKRRIAKGKTILESWWLDNESAMKAIDNLLITEGSGACFYEDENGDLVFETGDEP